MSVSKEVMDRLVELDKELDSLIMQFRARGVYIK